MADIYICFCFSCFFCRCLDQGFWKIDSYGHLGGLAPSNYRVPGYLAGLAPYSYILMGFAQTASVGRNLTMEYVRRVDALPREDFCERSSRNSVDDKGVFNAFFFIARRAGKVTTPSPSRFFSWPGVEEKQLWSPVCALFCQRSSRNVVDDKGIFTANIFRGGRLGKQLLHRFWTHFRAGGYLFAPPGRPGRPDGSEHRF